MSIPKVTTNQERNVTIAAMAGGFTVGHAITFVASDTGAHIGIAAAVILTLFIFFFDKHGQGLEHRARVLLRGAGSALLGLAAGGTLLYKIPMIDEGLVLVALAVSLFFFGLAKKGNTP